MSDKKKNKKDEELWYNKKSNIIIIAVVIIIIVLFAIFGIPQIYEYFVSRNEVEKIKLVTKGHSKWKNVLNNIKNVDISSQDKLDFRECIEDLKKSNILSDEGGSLCVNKSNHVKKLKSLEKTYEDFMIKLSKQKKWLDDNNINDFVKALGECKP